MPHNEGVLPGEVGRGITVPRPMDPGDNGGGSLIPMHLSVPFPDDSFDEESSSQERSSVSPGSAA